MFTHERIGIPSDDHLPLPGSFCRLKLMRLMSCKQRLHISSNKTANELAGYH